MTYKQALYWSSFWILSAISFDVFIYLNMGAVKAVEFGNAYIVEKLLSFDNLFIFPVIFEYFKENNQRKILNWGICGVIILRALCIFSGVELLNNFHWLLYVLGAALVYSSYGIFFSNDSEDDIGNSKIIRFCQSIGCNKFIMCLIAIELSDIVFAIDSIPAVLAITNDSFIAYSSNIFAILGLRSLYFVMKGISGFMEKMNYGIGVVLLFIGVKMLTADYIHIAPVLSMMIILSILSISAVITTIRINKIGGCD